MALQPDQIRMNIYAIEWDSYAMRCRAAVIAATELEALELVRHETVKRHGEVVRRVGSAAHGAKPEVLAVEEP